jgi:hypothetical protein
MGWKALLGLICLLWLLPGAAWARVEAGGGMEYFTVQTYVRDLQGNYFQTLLKSTLGRARLGYVAGPLEVHGSFGLSDWVVSGKWQSNYYNFSSMDTFGTAWQQYWDVEIDYEFWNGLGVGVDYTDHSLQHYDVATNPYFIFLQYRSQAFDALLNYVPLRTSAVKMMMTLAYSPYTRFNVSQTTDTNSPDQNINTIFDYDSAGTGTRWSGRVQFQYRDSGGWGIDALYSVGFSRFPDLPGLGEYSLRYGTLTGYFTVFF